MQNVGEAVWVVTAYLVGALVTFGITFAVLLVIFLALTAVAAL